MKNERIHISIGFGDAILPVVKCEDGHDRVPLKPICDQIGIQWKRQKTKLLNDSYLTERFGMTLGVPRYPQMDEKPVEREQYLIRLDRVTSFLNTLSPRNINAQGNLESAEWLKSKHEEWDGALHAYETQGIAVKAGNGSSIVNVLAKIDGIKNPKLRQVAIEKANAAYGLDIPVVTQLGFGE
ncbi:phage antirepressor N-terminal domain-containing protein [Spongiibacter tropicus]|uniref:phage antirepressor N-terminal domain-containing protein n=2 Tax=Spongiibacter TaxID=630749 RepID=UPI000491B3C2|nr:phage antirepressor N-terminal domain-containing protein [Spongiibacter tropicus]